MLINPYKMQLARAFKDLFTPARYKVFYGGRGGGKSWAIAQALLILSLQRPMRILCAREFQTSIKDSVMSLLVDQIRRLGLQSQFRVTKTSIEAVNGSEFKFVGLRLNPTEIKSFEGVDICWVEEAQRVSAESWDILIPTIRKEGSEIWMSFNPVEATDPVFERFVKNSPPDSIVRKVNWNDNPWFSDVLNAERLYMLGNDPDAYDWIWEGNCRKISDAVIFRGKFRIDRFEAPKGMRFRFGADWGFASDPTTLVRCFVHERRLFIDYEAYALNCDLDKLADVFDTVPLSRKWPILADNSQPQTIKHVAGFGFNIRPGRKWPGCIEDGIAHMRSYEEIVVHERCYYTGQEMRLYSYKVDPVSQQVLPVIVDKHNHCMDALRYALGPLIGNQRGPRFSAAQVRVLENGF